MSRRTSKATGSSKLAAGRSVSARRTRRRRCSSRRAGCSRCSTGSGSPRLIVGVEQPFDVRLSAG